LTDTSNTKSHFMLEHKMNTSTEQNVP